VRTGVSLIALPAGVHGQAWTRARTRCRPGRRARIAGPGWAALAWSGPGRFPG